MSEFNFIDEAEIQTKIDSLIEQLDNDFIGWVVNKNVFKLVLTIEECYSYLENLKNGSLMKRDRYIEQTNDRLLSRYPYLPYCQHLELEGLLDENELDELKLLGRYEVEKDKVGFKLKIILDDFRKKIENELRWSGFDVEKNLDNDYDLYDLINGLNIRNSKVLDDFKKMIIKLQKNIDQALKEKVINEVIFGDEDDEPVESQDNKAPEQNDSKEKDSDSKPKVVPHPFSEEEHVQLFERLENSIPDETKIKYVYILDFLDNNEILLRKNKAKKRAYFKWINFKNGFVGSEIVTDQSRKNISPTTYQTYFEEFNKIYKKFNQKS